MKIKQVQVLVTMQVPKQVSDRDLKAYIYDAVGTMKGCYHPESPIRDFDGDKMHVQIIKQVGWSNK